MNKTQIMLISALGLTGLCALFAIWFAINQAMAQKSRADAAETRAVQAEQREVDLKAWIIQAQKRDQDTENAIFEIEKKHKGAIDPPVTDRMRDAMRWVRDTRPGAVPGGAR